LFAKEIGGQQRGKDKKETDQHTVSNKTYCFLGWQFSSHSDPETSVDLMGKKIGCTGASRTQPGAWLAVVEDAPVLFQLSALPQRGGDFPCQGHRPVGVLKKLGAFLAGFLNSGDEFLIEGRASHTQRWE
jgi:hypothetical protein